MYSDKLADMFLDYWNNFLTIECFASTYGYTEEHATTLLKTGKEIHNERARIIQECNRISDYASERYERD